MAYHSDRFGLGLNSMITGPLIGTTKGMGVTTGYRCRILLFAVKPDTLGACPQPAIAPYNYQRDDGTRATYPGRAAVPGKTGTISIVNLGTFDGEASTANAAQAQAQTKALSALPASPAPATSYFAIYARTSRSTVDVYRADRLSSGWSVGGANFTRKTQGIFSIPTSQAGASFGAVCGAILSNLPALGIECYQSGVSADKTAQIAFSVLTSNFTAPAQSALVWSNGVTPPGTDANAGGDVSLPDWLNPFSPNFGNPGGGSGSGSGSGSGGGGGSTGGAGSGGSGGGSGSGSGAAEEGSSTGAIVGILGAGALAYLLTKG